jgi:hypothetical protein
MLLTTPLLLTACANGFAGIAEQKPLVTADPICKAAVEPVCVSAKDVLTRRTATVLLKNNEGMLAACPSLRKKKCPAGQVPAVDDPARPVKPPPAQMDAKADPKTS